jgi:hypothetical protein
MKQKTTMKLIVAYSFFGTAFLVFLVSLINFTNTRNLNATTADIKHVDEQIFINDVAIPAPFISNQKKAGPNTILIQSVKKIPEPPAHLHE